MVQGQEKRKFVRFGYPFLIQYKPVEKEYDKEALKSSLVKKMKDFSFTKNVSEGGLCLITREKFKPDTQLRVEIYIPTRKEPIKALVKVAWIKKRTLRSGYDNGVSFIEMTDEDKKELSTCLRYFSQAKLDELLG